MNRQSGSSVGYVVVAVLLVILSLGGIWLLKSGLGSSDIKPQTEGVVKDVKKDSDSKKSDESKNKDNKDEAKSNKEIAKKESDEAKKKEEAKKAAEAAKEANRVNNENNSSKANSNDGTKTQSESTQNQIARTGATLPTDSSDLPQTGPAQSVLSMVVGAVAIFLSGYVYYHYGYPKRNQDY